MASQPPADVSQTKNSDQPDKKPNDKKPNSARPISAAFWALIVALLIFWLIGWWLGICGHWIHGLGVLVFVASLFELWSRGAASNIVSSTNTMPKWDPEHPFASLGEIHKYVIEEAAKSTDWYWTRKVWKSRSSQTIRFLFWLLAAIGGILPVVGTLFSGFFAKHSVDFKNGLWASFFLIIATALLGLDKAFGFSSGWARYVLAASNIRKSLEEFRMDWANLMAKAGPALIAANAANAKPSPETVTPLIERAKQFRSEVEGLVLQETKDWVTEFQSTMAQMEKDVATQLSTLKAQVDKTIQAKEEASKGGAIHLTVTNSLNALPGSLKVAVVDNESKIRQEEYLTVDSWTSKFLPPGIYQVKLDALFGSPPTGTALTPQIVTVKTGEVTTVNFKL